MKLRILPSAVQDLLDGFRFYESQGVGIGSYFVESLISDIESLRLYAGMHPKVFGYYRLLSKRFPFAIYYLKDRETVSVNAVLDCRRDPGWIREKLTR